MLRRQADSRRPHCSIRRYETERNRMSSARTKITTSQNIRKEEKKKKKEKTKG